MNRTRHTRRHRQHVLDQVLSLVPAVVPSPPGSTPRRCSSRSGRPVSGPSPLTLHASTASADQAAKGARIGRQDAAQVSANGCRQCGHALPEWSRRHLNRCQDVRCICFTGLPKARLWSGSCSDWLCKNGYHHTIVLQSSRLDAETHLAKGLAPLESPLRTRHSRRYTPKRLRHRLLHGRTVDPAMPQVVSKWLSIPPRSIDSHDDPFSPDFIGNRIIKNLISSRLVCDFFHSKIQ